MNTPNYPQYQPKGVPPVEYPQSPKPPAGPLLWIVGIVAGLAVLVTLLGVLNAVLITVGAMHPSSSDSEAVKCWKYERLAAGGDVSSMVEMGSCYDSGVAVSKDYVKARVWYEKAVAKGSADAMNHLGQLYLHGGYGMQQDFTKAREWFEKGAAAGGPDAMRSLADMYWHGYGVERDAQMGDQWRDRADQTQGDRIYREERVKFEQAAAAGDVSAMNKLGEYYRDASGVPRDYAKAVEWFEKAAATGKLGSLEAMNHLGDLYERGGFGIEEDDGKAVEWLEKAAYAGSRSAMCSLGAHYDALSHFHPNSEYPRKSKEWFDKCREVASGAVTR